MIIDAYRTAGTQQPDRSLASTQPPLPVPPEAIPVEPMSAARRAYLAWGKRSIDLVVGSILILLSLPVMFVLAIAIRIDSPGPAVFDQKRIGRGGRPFQVYKFRTMTHQPSGSLVWLEDEHGERRHKLRDDPRITRFGRWLRRSSLDELPQLMNVVKGEMSLIGPRPELPEIVALYEPWQHERHLVRPGVTGWWQVSGRSDKPMHEHTELDIYYVRRQSLRLDLQIAWRTVGVVFRGLGAF